jgi:protein-disulfide isomerase
MPIHRRTLLSVALAATSLPAAATGDASRTERALGNPRAGLTVTECFSLTCPHCANFAQQTLPELKAKWIEPGKLRWVFYDFPTDMTALQAAMVARYLPPERYEPFINALFASQGRWAYASSGAPEDELRILARAMDAEKRWNVDATPSFLVNGKLYEGAMSASEFASILAS